MKKLTKIGALAVGAAMVTMGAQAAQTPFELGFTKGSALSDLIIDVGTTSSLLGQTTVVDLSSSLGSLTTFNSIFGSSANGVSMGVVSGNTSAVQGQNIYATQVRGGGAGSSAAVAGTETVPSARSSTQVGNGASTLTTTPTLVWPTTTGASVNDTTKSYTSVVEANTGTSFLGKTGIQPGSAIDNTGVIYEDLFFSKANTALAYQGYFTFDYNNDLLTFTSANVSTAVPEPAAYGTIAGAGLLALSLGRQLRRKTA